jgi:hypothetical protein
MTKMVESYGQGYAWLHSIWDQHAKLGMWQVQASWHSTPWLCVCLVFLRWVLELCVCLEFLRWVLDLLWVMLGSHAGMMDGYE